MPTFWILERSATESMDVFSVCVFYAEKFWVYYWNTLQAVTRCRQQENNSVESCSSHVTLQAAQITARGFPWPCKDDTRYLHEAKGWHQVMSQGSGQSEDREGRRKQGWERTLKANCHRTWVNLWMGEKIISAPQYLPSNANTQIHRHRNHNTAAKTPKHKSLLEKWKWVSMDVYSETGCLISPDYHYILLELNVEALSLKKVLILKCWLHLCQAYWHHTRIGCSCHTNLECVLSWIRSSYNTTQR